MQSFVASKPAKSQNVDKSMQQFLTMFSVLTVVPFFSIGRSTRSVAQQLSKISSTRKKIETHPTQSTLLKNAWNGDPSAVFKTNTLVSAFCLDAGDTSDPSGSRKQFEGHSQLSSALS